MYAPNTGCTISCPFVHLAANNLKQNLDATITEKHDIHYFKEKTNAVTGRYYFPSLQSIRVGWYQTFEYKTSTIFLKIIYVLISFPQCLFQRNFWGYHDVG